MANIFRTLYSSHLVIRIHSEKCFKQFSRKVLQFFRHFLEIYWGYQRVYHKIERLCVLAHLSYLVWTFQICGKILQAFCRFMGFQCFLLPNSCCFWQFIVSHSCFEILWPFTFLPNLNVLDCIFDYFKHLWHVSCLEFVDAEGVRGRIVHILFLIGVNGRYKKMRESEKIKSLQIPQT